MDQGIEAEDPEKTTIAEAPRLPAPPIPVGTIIIPFNNFELLTPWIGLVAPALIATLAVVAVRRRRASTRQ